MLTRAVVAAHRLASAMRTGVVRSGVVLADAVRSRPLLAEALGSRPRLAEALRTGSRLAEALRAGSRLAETMLPGTRLTETMLARTGRSPGMTSTALGRTGLRDCLLAKARTGAVAISVVTRTILAGRFHGAADNKILHRARMNGAGRAVSVPAI